jgi:hypothetical protein
MLKKKIRNSREHFPGGGARPLRTSQRRASKSGVGVLLRQGFAGLRRRTYLRQAGSNGSASKKILPAEGRENSSLRSLRSLR